jgi:translocation and assembly module TamB
VTESAARPRHWWKYLLIASGVLALFVVAGLWYITTESFQNYVRKRTVQEIERISGGHAEVGTFHLVPFHLQVEVRNITVHGKEGPNEVPLAHADSLLAQVKVNSLLRTEFGFRTVVLDHPVVHIAIGPDGSTTNIPGFQVTPVPANVRVEQVFGLSIDHLSVRNGELLWADQKIPLDFDASGTKLEMNYSFLRGRYESHLSLGKVDTAFNGYRPFSWMTSADFALGTTFVDIQSLTWNSGRSWFKTSGRISDFRKPQIISNYEAQVDLQEVAAIARRQDLRHGFAEFKGEGRWSMEEFTTNGAMALRDLVWQNEQFVLKNAGATSDYTITDKQLKLSKLQGKLLGGSFTGDVQVDNWLKSTPLTPAIAGKREDVAVISAARPRGKPDERSKIASVQSGNVRLRVKDASIAELASSLDVRSHPLGRFHPVGLTAGTIDATWKGAPGNADVAFSFNVAPPARTASRELPITAQTQGRYHGPTDSLELTQFNLSTTASKVQATGTLAASSALRVAVSTSNLEEWRPLVAALGGPTDLPFRVDGNATFNGAIGGTFRSPTIAGTLVAEDFEFTVPATSRTAEREVQWDSLAASIQLTRKELSVRGGSLRRGETSSDFDLNASLQNGKFTPDSPYTAHVSLHKVDVASTAALAGFDYPVSGTADVMLQIAGTRAHPQVQGHIHAVNASAYDEPIEQFDADLRIASSETSLNGIHLTHGDATVAGTAAYSPANRGFRLDLSGKNFDLKRIRQIRLGHFQIEGYADGTLRGSGTLDDPVIDATAHIRDLKLDHEPAGTFDIEAVTRKGELHLTGQSDFAHGKLGVDGNITMHGDYPATIIAKMDQLDLDSLWRSFLGNQLTSHTAVAGAVSMQGPLRYPSQWTLSGTLPELAIELAYEKLHNDGPVKFTFAEQSLQIEPFHLVGEGTDLTGHGTIHFAGSKAIDLAADGQIEMKLLGSLDPNLTASGVTTIHMTVGGSLKDPLPQGRIEIKNGGAQYAGLPSGLSEMNGSLSFTKDRVHIDQLTGKTGGGTLDLRGDASYFNSQMNFNVAATGKDVRLRYPPGVSSTANAELHWIGSQASSTVSGDVIVNKLSVTPGFDFGSYLERSRQSASITPASSPLYNIKLDVGVQTAPELQMKTALARLSGDADLHLRGSVARPSVLGRADILEGDATFNGIKFRLERGDITFANPVAIEPQVNLQATTHVRNYDLDVTVTGTPDRLNINYRSEPPLPKSDIIALLALGRTSEESEQLQKQSGQSMFTDEATNLIINQALNATVSNRLQKLFGVSRIKIDPQGLTTETNPTARGPQVTIEEQFANNLSLSYSTNVSQSAQQIIQGEYYINRNLSVVGTRDQNGVVSFDVRIRRRKK